VRERGRGPDGRMANVALQSAGAAVIAATSVDPAHGPDNIISGYVLRQAAGRAAGGWAGPGAAGARTEAPRAQGARGQPGASGRRVSAAC
jgi:hypothetical protein